MARERQRLRRADRVETSIDRAVHAADEERRHRLDARQVVPVRRGALQPGHPGVENLGVALDAEDEGDVDADAGPEDLGDGGEALGRRGNLD